LTTRTVASDRRLTGDETRCGAACERRAVMTTGITFTSSTASRTGVRASHRPTCRWNVDEKGCRADKTVRMTPASRSADGRHVLMFMFTFGQAAGRGRPDFFVPAREPRRAQPSRRTRSRTSGDSGQKRDKGRQRWSCCVVARHAPCNTIPTRKPLTNVDKDVKFTLQCGRITREHHNPLTVLESSNE